MAKFSVRGRLWLANLLLLGILTGGPAAADAPASKAKGKNKSGGSVRSLDARVGKLEDTLFKEILDIAGLYEDAGQLERAKSLLEVLLKLNPDFPAIKERVDKLETKILDVQEVKYNLDTSKGWVAVGAGVAPDKVIRFDTEGEYKLSFSASLTADGFPEIETESEYVHSLPCGILMGMVVANGKPGKPFPIKASSSWTRKEAGPLMLKVNAPQGSKCTGKLVVRMSGLVPLE
jgi:hypothetical protein